MIFLNLLDFDGASFVALGCLLYSCMHLRVLGAAMTGHNLSVHRWTALALLVLHQLKLLDLLRFLILFHQTSNECCIICALFISIYASRRWIELLRVVRSCVTGCAREFRKIAANASTTCCANLDRVSSLLRLPGIRGNGWRMLHGCLMRCLRLLGRLDNVKVVLVLATSISVLRCVQNLFLTL